MKVEELVKEIREQERSLQYNAIEYGCVDSGIAANVASQAADKLEELAAALAQRDKEIAALRGALREAAAALDQAREDVACWGSYAGEYFRDKHDLEGDLDRLAKQASVARRALERGQEE